ncbi:VIT1/CCC1 transporter family protein [Candidatus Micrarchaeota archaeon]|nr:VIT1/CCC1 transporter family protein [Candidatus Micrarchaeota archaeon]
MQDVMTDHPEYHSVLGHGGIRDVILGANDGFVSMLGLVTGVASGTSESGFVVLAGIVGAVAAAISMALGNYISVKSQIEVYDAQIEQEKTEMRQMPDVERREVWEIYKKKGFRGKQLEGIVKHLTSNRKRWLNVMLQEELGIHAQDLGHPVQSGVLTGVAFAAAAAFPILPYAALPARTALWVSVALTLLAVFATGALKTRFTKRTWWISGMEMTLIAGIAAAIGFLAGDIVADVF